MTNLTPCRRVVALLETYVRRAPNSPLLPAMVPPLLGALSRAARANDDKALGDRMQARPLHIGAVRIRVGCVVTRNAVSACKQLLDDGVCTVRAAVASLFSRCVTVDVLRHGFRPLQGLLNKLCRTKPAVGEAPVEGSSPGQLLKPVLFAAARETDKRAARAGGDAFLWLLRAAAARDSPQVHSLGMPTYCDRGVVTTVHINAWKRSCSVGFPCT